jgi:hypothetical protein
VQDWITLLRRFYASIARFGSIEVYFVSTELFDGFAFDRPELLSFLIGRPRLPLLTLQFSAKYTVILPGTAVRYPNFRRLRVS